MSKIAAFIDGPNLYAASKQLNLAVDYKKLLAWLQQRGQLVRAYYYTAMTEDEEYNPLRQLVDWLDYNGYSLISKPAKSFTDHNGRQKTKGNMDIEIAVDVLDLAERVDEIILFSGDGDFRRLVEAVQRRGVRVTVVSTKESTPSMIADELRRQVDEFIDLDSLRDLILRDEKPQEKTLTLPRKAA